MHLIVCITLQGAETAVSAYYIFTGKRMIKELITFTVVFLPDWFGLICNSSLQTVYLRDHNSSVAGTQQRTPAQSIAVHPYTVVDSAAVEGGSQN